MFQSKRFVALDSSFVCNVAPEAQSCPCAHWCSQSRVIHGPCERPTLCNGPVVLATSGKIKKEREENFFSTFFIRHPYFCQSGAADRKGSRPLAKNGKETRHNEIIRDLRKCELIIVSNKNKVFQSSGVTNDKRKAVTASATTLCV